jgi:hypothetical protein
LPRTQIREELVPRSQEGGVKDETLYPGVFTPETLPFSAAPDRMKRRA